MKYMVGKELRCPGQTWREAQGLPINYFVFIECWNFTTAVEASNFEATLACK